jgi:molybdopterin synthase catalytic subunit
MSAVLPPPDACDWIEVTAQPLQSHIAEAWAAAATTGAVVCFSGVVREHSDGRSGVTSITYEAYEPEASRRLGQIAAEARRRWPVLVRVAMLHRVGDVVLTEPSVVVVVSAPHRPQAFDAARFCIDTLKETVPIWKREHWAGGSDWATCSHSVRPVREPSRSGNS